jgi:hypothetical protein
MDVRGPRPTGPDANGAGHGACLSTALADIDPSPSRDSPPESHRSSAGQDCPDPVAMVYGTFSALDPGGLADGELQRCCAPAGAWGRKAPSSARPG